jgi:hypothetical protein
MAVTLLHSDDDDFEPYFLEQLPSLEKAMIEHDLDPSAFTFAKSRSGAYRSYGSNASHHDYAVNTGEDTFTVTYANDQGFLDFLLASCVADDSSGAGQGDARKAPSESHERRSLIDGLSRWFGDRR